MLGRAVRLSPSAPYVFQRFSRLLSISPGNDLSKSCELEMIFEATVKKTSEREKGMNPTRIADWSRVLIVGVISAIAITGTQTRMLAGPHQSLDTKAQS